MYSHVYLYVIPFVIGRLTDAQGVITDGEGKYPESAKCSWLVEPQRSVQSLDKKPVITYIHYIIVNSYS